MRRKILSNSFLFPHFYISLRLLTQHTPAMLCILFDTPSHRTSLNSIKQCYKPYVTETHQSTSLADYVADMSPTCRRHGQMSANFSRSGMSARHDTVKTRRRHTHFISIKGDMFKSAQTYVCSDYHTQNVFELKEHADMSANCRHVVKCRVV